MANRKQLRAPTRSQTPPSAQSVYAASARRFVSTFLGQIENGITLFRTIDTDLTNVERALAYASALGMHERVAKAALMLQFQLLTRGQNHVALRILYAGLQGAQRSRDPELQSQVLLDIGYIQVVMGHFGDAEATFRRGATLAQRSNNLALKAAHWGAAGAALLSTSQIKRARRRIERAFSLAEKIDAKERLIPILTTYGALQRVENQPAEAIRCFDRALALSQEIGRIRGQTGLYASLATVHATLGDLPKAKQLLLDAIAIAERTGSVEYAAIAYWNLGNAQLQEGHREWAMELLNKGLAIGERAGQTDIVSGVLISLGVAVSSVETPESLAQAMTYWQRGLRLARDVGSNERISLLLNNLAELAQLMGELNLAETYLDEALTIARRNKTVWELATVLIQKGRLAIARDEHAYAARMFNQAIKIAQQVNYPEVMIDAQFEHMRLLFGRNPHKRKRLLIEIQKLRDYARLHHSLRVAEIQQWLEAVSVQ